MKKIFAIVLSLVMLLALCACGESAAPASTSTEAPTAEEAVEAAPAEEAAEAPAEEAAEPAAEEAAEPAAEETAEAPAQKLIVGFDAEFPPFGFIAADGSYDGFDLALAAELCNRLGWEFEAVPIDWNAKDAELSSGNINCIWNGFTYTGREEDYTWSDPYVDNSIVLVVKADSGITSLADLAGCSVMAQAASSAVDAINDNAEFAASLGEVVELADYNTGFMELKQGTVSAVAADLGVATYQIASNEGDYVILGEPISTEQYAVGFLKGNTELRDAVNAELLAMAQDGTMMKIAENYVEVGLVLESLCLCK